MTLPNTGRKRAQRLLPVPGPCAVCGALAERHHIDGDTSNNDLANLRPLCRLHHQEVDGRLAALVARAADASAVHAARQRARTACKWGHDFTPENTYTTPGGARQCRICRDLARRRWAARR